jgi:hypothetical protein
MHVIPFRVSNSQYSIVVVLQDENLSRIKEYDPAEVTLDKMGSPWNQLRLKDVIITYATDAEMMKVMRLMASGDVRKGLQLIARGFKFKPAEGDHDGPYLTMRDEGEKKH